MSSSDDREHFVTVFDSYFLPQGLCLYRSLERHCSPFHLWIVAIDEACENALLTLCLKHASVIKISEIENARLLAIKSERSIGEYCWTLTPFLPSHVFSRKSDLDRITYLDADLFFFDSAKALIDEFDRSGKHVQLTDHAFGPEYMQALKYGRFCVQFLTFRNTEPARKVLGWWQDRCIEWCFGRLEDGKFGDQKYLDDWPERFKSEVHVLTQAERTVAPWNVDYLAAKGSGVKPVFFHFHGLRLTGPRFLVLYSGYRIGARNRWIYEQYLVDFRSAIDGLRSLQIAPVWRPVTEGFRLLRVLWRILRGRFGWANV
jgi:hypothetical protein